MLRRTKSFALTRWRGTQVASHLPRRARLVEETKFPQTPSTWRKNTKIWEVKTIEKKVNRNRPYAYSFRVSADEKALIDSKVTASGLNRTDYLIRALSDKPIVSIGNGNEILAELKRQGNNLNQAVKNNYFGDITEQELLSVVDECKVVYRKLSSAIGGI